MNKFFRKMWLISVFLTFSVLAQAQRSVPRQKTSTPVRKTTTTKQEPSSLQQGIQTFTVKGVSFNMVSVAGGTFTMGATSEQGSDACDDEKPAHKVTLSSFAIGQTEVTQELWQAVMGNNPSEFWMWDLYGGGEPLWSKSVGMIVRPLSQS